MSRKVQFSVTIEFQDKIVLDSDIIEIANNIAQAIKREALNHSIAPEDSDTHTIGVSVIPQYLGEEIKLKII